MAGSTPPNVNMGFAEISDLPRASWVGAEPRHRRHRLPEHALPRASGRKPNLERAAENLRGRGDTVPEELLARVSPMGWTHVGLTGDYLWERTDDIAPGSYRPLNDPGAQFRSAV
jgi:Tn3 transposase DDE domain-containing protein